LTHYLSFITRPWLLAAAATAAQYSLAAATNTTFPLNPRDYDVPSHLKGFCQSPKA
jgi:hypothetical protein